MIFFYLAMLDVLTWVTQTWWVSKTIKRGQFETQYPKKLVYDTRQLGAILYTSGIADVIFKYRYIVYVFYIKSLNDV